MVVSALREASCRTLSPLTAHMVTRRIHASSFPLAMVEGSIVRPFHTYLHSAVWNDVDTGLLGQDYMIGADKVGNRP